MLKKICAILCFITILSATSISAFADILYGGSCGDNLTYIVDDEYNLVISGEGGINDYTSYGDNNLPWKAFRNDIRNVIVEEGVTYIGNFSLCGLQNADSILLPDTVLEIGTRALGWNQITQIYIPQGVTALPYGLFLNCSSLQSIWISNAISLIDERAFDGCPSLQTIYFYGTEKEWNAIEIADGNEALINAKKVFISEVQPTSISISSKPIYIIGEDESLDITVNLNHNDGTATPLSPDEYEIETNFDPTTEGEYTIKVTFGDFTDEITVKVEQLKLMSIEITTPPNTTEFIEGTELDLSGMVITGTYNNGRTEEITDYTVSPYNNSTIGKQVLTISYGELSTTLTVTVVRKSISGIKITSLPYKTYYCNDETELDLTGLEVETLYNNGTSEKNTSYKVSGFDGSQSGMQTITVQYSFFTDTFDVEVKRYEYKVDSDIKRNYDFNSKTYTISASITSRTIARPVKVIVAVYNDNGAMAGVKISDEYFDTGATKTVNLSVDNIEYPYNTVKVLVWDYEFGKMMPLALGV